MSPIRQPRERKHISPSEVKAFLSCPAQWYFKYRLSLWTDRQAPFFAMGDMVHAGLERWYYPKDPRNQEAALAQFRRKTAQVVDKVPWEDYPKDDPLTMRADGEKLLLAALTVPDDDWEALGVETTLYADIEHSRLGKLPVKLKARADMVLANHDFVDHKTADKSWPEGKERGEVQAVAYAMVGRANYGHDPVTTFNVMVNNVKAKVDRRPTRATQDDIDRFYFAARLILEADEKGIAYPNPTAFFHSTCDYRKLCDQWDGRSTPIDVPDGRPLQLLVPGLSDWAVGLEQPRAA